MDNPFLDRNSTEKATTHLTFALCLWCASASENIYLQERQWLRSGLLPRFRGFLCTCGCGGGAVAPPLSFWSAFRPGALPPLVSIALMRGGPRPGAAAPAGEPGALAGC